MGFIGLHTARRFLDTGQEVVLTQFRVRREPEFLPELHDGGAQAKVLDVADAGAVRRVVSRYSISSIVHLAVPGHVPDPLAGIAARQIMAFTGQNGRTAGCGAGIGPLEFHGQDTAGLLPGGSDGGGVLRGGRREDQHDPPWAEEQTVPAAVADKPPGPVGLSARIGGVYGPLYHSMANLPSRLCHAAVAGNAPDLAGRRGGIALADDESDLCYVKDCASGLHLLHTAEALRHRVYNISGGRAVANRELAAAVAEVTGTSIELPPGRSSGSTKDRYMDLSRARRELGYEPAYDVRRGVAEYVEGLRANAQ